MNDKLIDSRKERTKEIAILGFIILLGIGLRLYHIDFETLWNDEIRIVKASEGSIYSILKNESRENSPPLYILLEHFWMKLFGSSEFSVRSLSILFGVLLIPSVYIVARRMFNSATSACISALIVAISPYQIYYSQNNKHYTLLPLMSLLSVYFLYRLLNENKNTSRILYIITTSLCTYIHYHGLFLFVVGYIYLFLTKRHNRFVLCKKLLFCQFVILLLFMPWVNTLLSQIAAGGATYTLKKPSILVIGDSLISFNSFCAANKNKFIMFLTLVSILFIIKGIFIKPVQNWFSLPTSQNVEDYPKIITQYSVSSSHILLLEYLLSPLIVAYLFSILIQPVYFAGRYDNISYPAFCLLVGSGIASIKDRFVRRIVTAGILILVCNPLYNYYYNTLKSHECRQIISFIKDLSLKDRTTMIVCPSCAPLELTYYSEKNNSNVDVQGFFPRTKEGATAMIQDVMNSNSHDRGNEVSRFLTHYDNGNNSKILENEVIKYFYPVKERWFNRGATRVVYYEELPPDYYVMNDSTINFWDKSQRKYLINGWSTTEEWGTWSEGQESLIILKFKEPKDYTMQIKASGFSISGKQQSVKIYLDDNLLGEHTFTQPTTYFEDFEVKIPSACIKRGNQQIKFVYSFTGSPAEHGMGPDVRQLAMGVSSIEFK